ncbi:hypothetical protein KY345_04965 [Candidatus Woesearchaeota archaeon]|nr:hypothetical protein [Candidatus Woesearchaeota archaeon]
MKFSISKEVFEQFAELSVGLVIVSDMDNKGESEELAKLVDEIVELVKANYNPTEFANNSLISPWKSAYFDYEEKPHITHSSVERLIKEIFGKGDVSRKNKLRDICSLVSLKHTVPVECFNSGEIDGNFSLKRAEGDEHMLDGGHPEKGEFIYHDTLGVLARKLDYVESEKTLVDERTKKAVVLIEGLKPLLKAKVEEITKETADLVKTFCKGEVNFLVLDKENSEVEF